MDPNTKSALHLDVRMTRAKLDSISNTYIQRTHEPCMQCIRDSGLEKSEINTVLLVGGMTRDPAVQAFVRKVFGREPSRSINPDEAVALGAATQAGVMMGKVDNLVLLDVTPLTLGIETLGGVSTAIIDRNTTIPSKNEKVFSTAADNQAQVNIKVLQGERPNAADNKALGEFVLDGIPPAPRGVPQIKVTFDIDASGIVHVSAMDKTTGKEQKITVKSDGGLTEDEIKKMTEQAELYKEKDNKMRKIIELKNEVETQIYAGEKSLREYRKKLPDDLVKEIEKNINKAKECSVKKEVDEEELRSAVTTLKESVMKIGGAIAREKESASKEGAEKDKKDEEKRADKSEKGGKKEAADAEYEDVSQNK